MANPPQFDIVILYRQPDLMALWGIPHGMRREVGQSPRDLWERRGELGWKWLGSPGWWGSLNQAEIEAIKRFLKPIQAAGMVPEGPGEWTDLRD